MVQINRKLSLFLLIFTSTHYCDTIINDVDIYVINANATIAEAVVVRFHPLMLQIVASPGVVATVWE